MLCFCREIHCHCRSFPKRIGTGTIFNYFHRSLGRIYNLIFILLVFQSCSSQTLPLEEIIMNDAVTNKKFLKIDHLNKIKRSNITIDLHALDTVYIKPNQTLQLKNGWRLIGDSQTVIQVDHFPDNLTNVNPFYKAMILIKNADDVEINGCTLSMAPFQETTPTGAITIDNEEENLDKGITIKNVFVDSAFCAVWVKRGNNITVDSSYFINNGHHIWLGHLDLPTEEIKKHKVDRCTIENSYFLNTLIDSSNCIKTRSNCTGVVIVKNVIKDSKGDGIDLFPGGNDVSIINNTIRDNNFHGIEVKMTDLYSPEVTGQISRVYIYNNQISHNRFTGITVLDEAAQYHAQGIVIDSNRIDSSGQYGIITYLPIRIEKNQLNANGWRIRDVGNKDAAYAQIYALEVKKPGDLLVLDNYLYNTGFYPDFELAYWMNFNGISVPTQIKGNTLEYVHLPPYKPTFKAYGISYFNPRPPITKRYLLDNNEFRTNFIKKVVFNRAQ